MRMLANGSFCCDEHRSLYEAERSMPPLGVPMLLVRPEPRPIRSLKPPSVNIGGSPQPVAQASSACVPTRPPVEGSTRYCQAMPIERPTPKRPTIERNVAVPQPSGPSSPTLGVGRPSRKTQQSDGGLRLAGRVDQAFGGPLPSQGRPIVKEISSEALATTYHPLSPACPAPAVTQPNPWPRKAELRPLRLEPAARTQKAALVRALRPPAGFAGKPLIPRLHIRPEAPAA